MNILFKTIFLGSMLMAVPLSAQVSRELIDKAKAAGMSDVQIQEEINKRVGKDESTGTTKIPTANMTGKEREEPVIPAQNPLLQESAALRNNNIVFGREIFSDKNLSFSPSLNIPTPKDYQLSAGDEIIINVYGTSEFNLTQKISPDGIILIPDVGPVFLSGLTIDQASARIKQELGRIMSGLNGEAPNTFVNVSLGQIRSIKVNIVGEAVAPGTYTLPSFATLFNALYAAGGVNDIGTLRNIKIYRTGKLIATMDVYEYLLNGKFSSNIRLEDNDMIMIGTYDNQAAIQGKVKRNRIFELKNGETLQQLIDYAGGFMGDAFMDNIRIFRKAGNRYSIATVKKEDFASFQLMDQDSVIVEASIPFFENRLRITGAVWRPGEYQLDDETQTVKQLIQKAAGVKGDEFTGHAQLVRLNPDFTKQAISLDIKGILNGTAADIPLKPEDALYIPSLFDLREDYTVKVRGAVNRTDTTLTFKNNMTVSDAIIEAGGLREAAANIKVEVARRIKDPYSEKHSDETAQVFTLTLTDNLQPTEDFILQPFDEVIVRFSPGYQQQQIVTINGEVLFTGPYVLSRKNERLSDLVRKAGGVSTEAYVKGASLKRKMNEDELRRVQTMLELSANKASRDSMDVHQLNLNNYTVGIDLKKALSHPGSADDIVLRNGDELYIPQFQSTVKISGAVTYPNSVTYTKGMNVKDCLSQAGGYTDMSRKYPIVIYMNGKVATTKKVWLFFKKYPKVEPGAEILIPMKKISDQRRASLAEILSIGSSATSMAAMITSIVNTLDKK